MTKDNVDAKELFWGIVCALLVFGLLLMFWLDAIDDPTWTTFENFVIRCSLENETIGCLLGGMK